jgi:hypothetical protein
MTSSFHPMATILPLSAAVLAAAALGSCGTAPLPGEGLLPIGALEQLYQETRTLRDGIDVTRSRGATATMEAVALSDLLERYSTLRTRLRRGLAAGASPPLSEQDALALEVMKRTLADELAPEEPAGASASGDGSADRAGDCIYDAERVASGRGGYEALSDRIYACFSIAAHSLSFEGEEMDRLTLFGLLPLTHDPSRREGLWRAFAPIWEAVNGDNGPQSPYRTLVRKNAARMKEEGEVLGDSVRSVGVEPATMEAWLMRVLEKWHDITPDTPIEPWDFTYHAGRGSRALSKSIPLESLRPINDRFYGDLGADPAALRVQYDLEPRAGKDPVAFTTFGQRPRMQGEQVIPGESWVFASYGIGGLDNLLELLHETGHAIHIAAIRTRPAFTDWPDSDIFTEGIADLAALEMYEPAWQQRYLGTSVPIEAGIVAKYAGIVMDVAWALFEVRLHREPERDPNEVWTEITALYFRIEPHPDRAWWAVRGQLVDAPGYMMNYAAGAILAADLRARIRDLYGPYSEGDPDWYGRVAETLYRFGLERPSKQVIEDFLGRPVSPHALLDDMARAIEGTAIEAAAHRPRPRRGESSSRLYW